MNINVLPGIRKSKQLPGVLGLYVKLPDSLFAINLTPGIFEQLKESFETEIADFDRQVIFFSTSPMNLGGIDLLAQYIKENVDRKVTLSAPEALCGWFHALLRETDYASEYLKALDFNSFATNKSSTIQFSSRYVINYLPTLEGFSDYIIKIKFGSPDISLNFCEIRDINAPFPKELVDSDILVCNFSRYPNICSSNSVIADLPQKMKTILARYNIKSALFPTADGIYQLLPATKPNYENVVKSDTYTIDLKDAAIIVNHEKNLNNYKRSIFPVLVEDEGHKESIMLGLDLGAALHLRLKKREQFSFTSILLAGCSFHHVFALTDVMDQLNERNVNLFCGKYMGSAVNHFKSLFFRTFSREVKNNLHVQAGEQGKTIRHQLDDAFEVILIPYPKNPDSYIIRITELQTQEVLLFTDAILSKTFFKRNLQGVSSLVFVINSDNNEELDTYREEFNSLQEKYKLKKVILLYPGGTLISDSEI